MRLSNICDEDLKKIALLKTRKGTATSEAKRAQQILYSRNISHGGFGVGPGKSFSSTIDVNIDRKYVTFKEEHCCSIEEYLEREKERLASKIDKARMTFRQRHTKEAYNDQD